MFNQYVNNHSKLDSLFTYETLINVDDYDMFLIGRGM